MMDFRPALSGNFFFKHGTRIALRAVIIAYSMKLRVIGS